MATHSPGKPPCDWDDRGARESLVDELVHDALSALAALDGAELAAPGRDAAELLALVAGQDVVQGDDGRFRIAKKVAKDRTISTVDTEARHGHKSANRHFDGYKTHLSIDPTSELIDEVAVSAANAPDAAAVSDLLANHADDTDKPEVIGDSAYGSAAARSALEDQGYPVTAKAAPVRNSTGGFSKEDFDLDLDEGAVTCPAGHTVPVHFGPRRGQGIVQGPLPALPAKGPMHAFPSGADDIGPPPRGTAAPGPGRAKKPPMASPLQINAPHCRAQDRPFRPPALGRAQGPGAREKRVTTDVLARAAALNWARLATLGLVFGDRGWSLS